MKLYLALSSKHGSSWLYTSQGKCLFRRLRTVWLPISHDGASGYLGHILENIIFFLSGIGNVFQILYRMIFWVLPLLPLLLVNITDTCKATDELLTGNVILPPVSEPSKYVERLLVNLLFALLLNLGNLSQLIALHIIFWNPVLICWKCTFHQGLLFLITAANVVIDHHIGTCLRNSSGHPSIVFLERWSIAEPLLAFKEHHLVKRLLTAVAV